MDFLPKQADLADRSPGFEPYQVVCLEYQASRLYGEVVQVVEHRQVCWVRPLMLTVATIAREGEIDAEPCFYDLRNGADLLLPAALFRAALDVEVIPLFSRLHSSERINYSPDLNGHQQLNYLIRRVWGAYPEVFQV